MAKKIRLATKDERTVLDGVRIRLINPDEQMRWDDLITQEHYLRNAQMVGERLCYVAEYQGQWVALMGWAAPAWHLKAREEWLCWTEAQRKVRLHLLAQNTRFLIRADRHQVPNLGSRLLKMVCQGLSEDWYLAYRHPILAVESFIDPQLHEGSAYKAAGWTPLGYTAGFGRVGEDFYLPHERPKQLWVKSLIADAPAVFSAELLPAPWTAYEKALPPGCGQANDQLTSLYDRFSALSDARKGQGKRHRLATVLSIVACAKLAGVKWGYRHIFRYARGLKKLQRKALRCWIHPRTGAYTVPSESCFLRVLGNLDGPHFEAIVTRWQKEVLGQEPEPELVAIDGKTVLHSGVHLTGAVSVPSLHCLGLEPVPDKTNEIMAARTLLRRLDIVGRPVMLDALHTQHETVQQLLYENGADYLLPLKDNQPTLLKTAQSLLPAGVSPSSGHLRAQPRTAGTAGDCGDRNPAHPTGLGGSGATPAD